ncbi:MAG: hypothetical protein U5K31_08625 [Balneolaceae bacterium]|nr:hypothetical protein [Balneolaceae bacterium]
MEELNGTSIFWLIALGLLIGGLTKLVLGNKGVGLVPNVAGGAVGSVVVGGIGLALQLPGTLLFALLGSISILFLANVFYLQEDHGHNEAHP